jgi:primosomal protein N' (replication factor Y)
MVAKGHDFRRVTLVAAVNPDTALFSSDFRAPERLFALLMQAAGRAGRDAEQAARSEMWVQTWHPRHPIYAALRAHDYEAFAGAQLEETARAAGLPPFAALALLRADARTVEARQTFWPRPACAGAGLGRCHRLPGRAAARGQGGRRGTHADAGGVDPHAHRAAAHAGGLAAATAGLVRTRHKGLLRWAVDVDPLVI